MQKDRTRPQPRRTDEEITFTFITSCTDCNTCTKIAKKQRQITLWNTLRSEYERKFR